MNHFSRIRRRSRCLVVNVRASRVATIKYLAPHTDVLNVKVEDNGVSLPRFIYVLTAVHIPICFGIDGEQMVMRAPYRIVGLLCN